MEHKTLLINEKTVERFITADDVIRCVENTWKWYGSGQVIMPDKITTDMSAAGISGWFNAMPAYIAPVDVAGIKVVGGYAGNRALGLPYIKSNIMITDSRTGILKAVISGDYINNMRTGAQPAIMARVLASSTDVVTVIGTGIQGCTSLLCMSRILTLHEVRLYDTSEKAMDTLINYSGRNGLHDINFIKCKNCEEACRGADVIITATNADSSDLVEEPWLKAGSLVMTMGSFRETSYDVVRRADKIAVDQVSQSLHRGNLKELAEMGEISKESIDIVVPEVLAGRMPGRTNPGERICAQIIGTGMLDVAVAGLLLERIEASGEKVPEFNMIE